MTLAFCPRLLVRALAGVSLMALLATGCDYKPSDEVAIKVNGKVTTMGEFRDLVAGLEAGQICIGLLNLPTPVKFSSSGANNSAVRFVGNLVSQSAVLHGVLSSKDKLPTADQIVAAKKQLTKVCPGGADTALSTKMQDLLTGFIAENAVVTTQNLGSDAGSALAAADVVVNPRVGQWDASTGSLAAPRGPVRIKVTATTTTAAP